MEVLADQAVLNRREVIRRLAAAMLHRSVRDLILYRAAKEPYMRRRAEQARAWLNGENWSWSLTYREACAALNLPVEAVRAKALRMTREEYRDRRNIGGHRSLRDSIVRE